MQQIDPTHAHLRTYLKMDPHQPKHLAFYICGWRVRQGAQNPSVLWLVVAPDSKIDAFDLGVLWRRKTAVGNRVRDLVRCCQCGVRHAVRRA